MRLLRNLYEILVRWTHVHKWVTVGTGHYTSSVDYVYQNCPECNNYRVIRLDQSRNL